MDMHSFGNLYDMNQQHRYPLKIAISPITPSVSCRFQKLQQILLLLLIFCDDYFPDAFA